MKCRFINCNREAGDHEYDSVYNNACKKCMDIYFMFDAHITGREVHGFKPGDYEEWIKKNN